MGTPSIVTRALFFFLPSDIVVGILRDGTSVFMIPLTRTLNLIC